MSETVELPTSAVDDALEELEKGMRWSQNHFEADETRPSAFLMAQAHKEAYELLVEAHPNYDLTEGDDG